MKRAGLLLIVLLIFGFTGCIQEYNYTEEQSDSAAEYMAGMLLKSDQDYDQELISEEELAEELVPAVSVAPASDITAQNKPTNPSQAAVNSSEPQKDYTLSEVIGAEDFDLQYQDYIVSESYPEDATDTYFTITPREGNQLVVVNFLLTNQTKKKKTLNLTKADILFQLDVNVGTIYQPSLSLIENDLQYIDVSLKGGAKKQVLLIFEIKKNEDMKDINLIVSQDDKSAIIKLK